MLIDKLFGDAGILASGICALIGLICLGRIPTTVRVLVVHALLSFYVDTLGKFNTTLNNHAIFIVYLPLDLLLVCLAARDYLGRFFVPLLSGGLIVGLGVYGYVLNRQGWDYIPSEAVVTSFIIQGIVWFVALVRMLRQPLGRNVTAVYIISGSILLFVCCSVPTWAMFRYNLTHHPELARSLQGLVNVVNTLRYTGTGIAFILLANNGIPQKHDAGR